ncbi:MAG TPA: YetF domain-containing protein [Pyrinomonadaceae bacterium]|nr:YetF domain-containing protein [Pyrinomonadaceae bacterium]
MFINILSTIVASPAWENMLELGDKVTWPEKVLRPIVVYVGLIILLRVVGKRELAQLNPLDLVVILLLSNTVQNAIIGDDTSLVGGLVGGAVLLLLNTALNYLKLRSRKIETAIDGRPVTLIENGEINTRRVRRELMTRTDLDIIAHEKDLDDASHIEKLVLDPNGTALVEAKDDIKDVKFKREVLKKINELSKQLADLNAALQKS